MDKAIITIDIPKSREHEKEVIIQELAMKLLSQCEHGDTLIKAISDHNNEFDGREAPICEAESIIENQMYDLLTNPVKDMKTRMFKLLGLDKFLDKNPADPKYAYLYKSLDGTDEDEPVLSQDTYKEYFKVKYKFNLDQLVTYEAAKKMDEILSKMSPEYFKDKVNVVSKDLGEFRLGRWVEEEKTMYIKPDIFNQEWILSPESKVNLGQKVLAHELGHKIDHEYDYSKNDKWREISGWTKQESKDKIRSHYNMNGLWKVGKWYHDKTAAFINEYASRNPKEDFSESFAYAVIGLDQWFEVKECEDKKEFLKQYVLPDDIVLPNIKEQTQPGDVEMAKAVAEDKHYIMLEKSVQDYVGQNMVFRDGNNIVVAVKKIKAINDASDMFGPGTYNVETEAHGILGAMTAETIASLIDTVEPVEKSLGEQRPGHKYIRREGPAGGPYKYIYHDAQNKEYETEMQPSPKQILNHAKEKFEKNGMSTEIISINSDKAKELMRKMVGSKKLIGTQSNMQQIIQDTKEGKVYLIKENMRHPVSDKTVHHEHGHKVLWDTQNEIYKEYLNAAQNTKYYAEPDIITRDKMPIEAFAQEWAIYKTKPNILKHSSPEIFKVMQKAEKLYNNNEPSGYTEFENTKIGDLESIGNRRGLSASMSPNFNRQKNAIYEQLKAKGYTPNQISNMTVSEAKSELQKENKNQYELPSKQIEILASTGIRVDSPEEFKRNPGIKARIETAMDVMGTKEINEKMKLTIKPNNLANMGKNVKGRYFKQLTTIEVSPKHGESFIHEYGHFIDHAMGKKKGEKGYLTDSGIAWGAVKKGETYNNFDEAVDKTELSNRIQNEVIMYHPKKEQFDALRYYNNSAEVFARTFEQYIAYKIGNQESKDKSVDPETGLRPRKYIAFAQLGNDYKTLCKKPHYFTDKEFQTIAPKFEAVLKKYLGNELLKAIMDDLEKALGQERAGHKYIRRIQNPRTGGWTYIYEEGQQRQPGTQPQEAPVTAQAEQNEGDYKYTYYHATPKAKAIHKKGFKDDTYVWVTKKQAEDYVKTQQEPGEKWEVVTVKSKEKLKADDPNITDEDKMDHGEYWMLKKENIKPDHPEMTDKGYREQVTWHKGWAGVEKAEKINQWLSEYKQAQTRFKTETLNTMLDEKTKKEADKLMVDDLITGYNIDQYGIMDREKSDMIMSDKLQVVYNMYHAHPEHGEKLLKKIAEAGITPEYTVDDFASSVIWDPTWDKESELTYEKVGDKTIARSMQYSIYFQPKNQQEADKIAEIIDKYANKTSNPDKAIQDSWFVPDVRSTGSKADAHQEKNINRKIVNGKAMMTLSKQAIKGWETKKIWIQKELAEFIKALGQERLGHKYIRRILNPRTGGWTYIYEEGQQRQHGTQPQIKSVSDTMKELADNKKELINAIKKVQPETTDMLGPKFKKTFIGEDMFYVKNAGKKNEEWLPVEDVAEALLSTDEAKEIIGKAQESPVTAQAEQPETKGQGKVEEQPEHPEAKGQGKTKPDGQVQKKETYVYHTTSPKNIESIAKHGMKPAIGMYGKGVYFAPSMEETGGYGSPEGAMIRMHRNNLPKDWNELEEQGFTEKPITADKLEVSLDKGKTWKPLNPSHPESKGQGKTETEPAQPKESKPVKEKKPKSEPKYLAKWVDKKSGKTLYLYPWSKPKEMNWKGYEDIIDDIMTNGGLKPYEKHSGILGMKVTKGDLWEEIKGAVPLWMMRKGGGTLDTHAQRHKMSESELLDRIVTARDSRIEAMNKLVADYQSRVEILGEGIAHVKTSEVEEATKESEIQEKEAGLENMPEATAESVVTELDSAAAEQERKMQEYADSMDQMEDTMNEYMLKQRAEETH